MMQNTYVMDPVIGAVSLEESLGFSR